jgi:type IV protein arginine methyltransferase
MSKPYIQQILTYTEDGRLMDETGQAVMMEWERPIMEQAAQVITRNGGRVLNVGFGMGIIDTEIEKYPITEHWIIEPHLDVYTKMLNDGWHLKPHVTILYGDWQYYMKFLPEFDGIYIDTWDEQIWDFLKNTPNMLKKGGVLSFFNNPRGDEKGLHMSQEEYDILSPICQIDYETIELNHIDGPDKQTANGGFYWHPDWKTYYCPIVKLK